MQLSKMLNNIFNIELAFINTLTNKFFGKDIINFDNQFNRNNEPRIKGRGIVVENDPTEISKGVFTTCKKETAVSVGIIKS